MVKKKIKNKDEGHPKKQAWKKDYIVHVNLVEMYILFEYEQINFNKIKENFQQVLIFIYWGN